MYSNVYFALVNEYMELMQYGMGQAWTLNKMKEIITIVEELGIDVYIEFEKLCNAIEEYRDRTF